MGDMKRKIFNTESEMQNRIRYLSMPISHSFSKKGNTINQGVNISGNEEYKMKGLRTASGVLNFEGMKDDYECITEYLETEKYNENKSKGKNQKKLFFINVRKRK